MDKDREKCNCEIGFTCYRCLKFAEVEELKKEELKELADTKAELIALKKENEALVIRDKWVTDLEDIRLKYDALKKSIEEVEGLPERPVFNFVGKFELEKYLDKVGLYVAKLKQEHAEEVEELKKEELKELADVKEQLSKEIMKNVELQRSIDDVKELPEKTACICYEKDFGDGIHCICGAKAVNKTIDLCRLAMVKKEQDINELQEKVALWNLDSLDRTIELDCRKKLVARIAELEKQLKEKT